MKCTHDLFSSKYVTKKTKKMGKKGKRNEFKVGFYFFFKKKKKEKEKNYNFVQRLAVPAKCTNKRFNEMFVFFKKKVCI
jgi:hypothetical protein